MLKTEKKYSWKSTEKKTKSGKKKPYRSWEKKKLNQTRKKIGTVRYHTEKQQKNSKTEKKKKTGRMPGTGRNTSFQERRKDVKGSSKRNRPPNPPEKIIPGAQFYKEPRRIIKRRRKKSRKGHTPIQSQNRLLERQPGVLELHSSKKTRKKKIRRPSYCVKDAAGAGGEPNLQSRW